MKIINHISKDNIIFSSDTFEGFQYSLNIKNIAVDEIEEAITKAIECAYFEHNLFSLLDVEGFIIDSKWYHNTQLVIEEDKRASLVSGEYFYTYMYKPVYLGYLCCLESYGYPVLVLFKQ